ncbi:MAG: hypothetical protein HY292_04995 [Planctomycetes bacterium]|nr:hypothetical protein [Planctomycetota bacterium]
MSTRLVISIVFFGLTVAVASSASAQLRRIDGCTFRTIVAPLTEPRPRTDQPPQTCGAIPVIEDAWTMATACQGQTGDLLESETYQFLQFGPVQTDVVFVTKVKLPNSIQRAFPWTLTEDIVVLPCIPRTSGNPTGEDFAPTSRPPMVLIDDVTFPPLESGPDGAPANEWLCAVVVPLQDFADPFGVSGSLDWFAVIDFDTAGTRYSQPPTPDLDGNGCPDAAIEVGVQGRFVPHVGMDEIGAGLVDFILNRGALGLTRVDVFEPQNASALPAQLGGMQTGESHNSRPWCFSFAIGL